MTRSAPTTVLLLNLALAVGALALLGDAPAADYVPEPGKEPEMERAETLYSEGSYALAHEAYARLVRRDLSPEKARWLDFRLADTSWRAQSGSETPDDTIFEQARQRLELLLRDVERAGDRDRVWAEAQESLGDFWWFRNNSRNWGQAWPYYERALDWWAGSSSIKPARERYLGIVWKAARPPWAEPHYYYGYYGNQLSTRVLQNVLEITDDPGERAHAHYLIAMNLRGQGGNEAIRRRTSEAFEAAIELGRQTDWYDDALYHYGEWLARAGRVVAIEGGGFRQEPDYPGAVEIFRRLLSEFDKGETRYHDQARQQIETITSPQVGVSVSDFFLPGSEIRYHLSWRNVAGVELALYAVELTEDVRLTTGDGGGDWLNRIELRGRRPTRSWSHPTRDASNHFPVQQTVALEGALATGAYVIEARAAGKSARDLVLVSDASVVVKTAGSRTLVYFCEAVAGAPLADADVSVWARFRAGREWRWEHATARTDPEGLAVMDLAHEADRMDLFVAASSEDHQAFSLARSWFPTRESESWRIYAFTDRPAYRPGEQVQWKTVVRQYAASGYSTPSGHALHYEITDPRGAKIDEGKLELNRFGSARGDLELDPDMPLGEYRVTFRDRKGGRTVGNAVLFRLEEYKLPEFRVTIANPEEDGSPRAFRPGETVETDVLAEYYFGGPVANASVEVLVYQQPLHIRWQPPREFPWFYSDIESRPHRGWGGPGTIVHRETLTTDAEGRARVAFDTPQSTDQDFEYTVEARVTDASRREILGRGKVRTSRQRYFAFIRAEHQLYRPGDRVGVKLKTVDANERPQRAEARVRVTRDRWVEVWLDPAGRQVRGERLERIRSRSAHFPPPPPQPGDPGWRLEFRGYEHDEILSQLVRTGEDGEAELKFTPDGVGFYRIVWSGDEAELFPVRAETTVWVADRDTARLGYRSGGVEIVVDDDTFRVGRRTPVMLSAPAADSYVLFTVESDDLHSYRLVHLTGNVKLLELDIEEQHVPNVFLGAAMVHDGELSMDSKQVVVPPLRNFLDVEVATDRDEYRPGESGRLTVTTRDHEGNPVAAEVALALVDDSVFYIQEDYAGDPRQFFFGTKRPRRVQTSSSFQQKRFGKLTRDEGGGWLDDLRGERRDRPAPVAPSSGPLLAGSRQRAETLAMKSMDEQVLFEGEMDAMSAPAEARLADASGVGATPGDETTVVVRSDFRSTALWAPQLTTGEDGRGSVEVRFPDSLTTWRATARVADEGNRFGTAGSSTRTNKPLIVRLQAPRFFVAGDDVTLSALVNNNTDGTLRVDAAIEASGLSLLGNHEGSIVVPANGEVRLDWRAEAREAGAAQLKVTARADGLADAMKRDFTVYEHGVEKLLGRSGKLRGDEVRVKLDIPRERRNGSTSLTVQVSPSLAVTMLDALPYLIDYPYGCTEQTMSRFLPAVITARTLESLGLGAEAIADRVFGGIEPQHADATHRGGKKDLSRLDEMVRKGLGRLHDFQHGDGGWGWWKDGESDPFMSAYVVWGLALARDAGVDIRHGVLRRGVEFLDRELVEQEQHLHLQAFMLHAVATAATGGEPSKFQRTAFDNLWTERDRLNAYSRSLLALSAHAFGDVERARTLVRNLVNGVERDRSPDTSVVMRGAQSSNAAVMGTAHWGRDGLYWRWYDGGVETTAFALRALVAIDPGNELIEPVTNWLIRNRRGAQWSNTRDTAMTVLALSEYLPASGELGGDLEFELQVNGKTVETGRITPQRILEAPSRFTIDPDLIRDGANEIRIRRTSGDGPIYFAAEARFFSLEEPITPAGNEIFVRRQYHELVGRPTLLKGYVYEKQPLADGETVTSGERVEVVVTLEAKNDYEYLVVEDLKPAGLESVQLKSGEPLYARELKSGSLEVPSDEREPQDYTGRSRRVHQELRDRKVAMFIDKLPEGVWEIRYELRAEVPGSFHALPALAHAMYVPEIRANGAEIRIDVEDRTEMSK